MLIFHTSKWLLINFGYFGSEFQNGVAANCRYLSLHATLDANFRLFIISWLMMALTVVKVKK